MQRECGLFKQGKHLVQALPECDRIGQGGSAVTGYTNGQRETRRGRTIKTDRSGLRKSQALVDPAAAIEDDRIADVLDIVPIDDAKAVPDQTSIVRILVVNDELVIRATHDPNLIAGWASFQMVAINVVGSDDRIVSHKPESRRAHDLEGDFMIATGGLADNWKFVTLLHLPRGTDAAEDLTGRDLGTNMKPLVVLCCPTGLFFDACHLLSPV
jgi:hypothetical protein